MLTSSIRRFLLVAAGSAVGAYLCARFQFGFAFSPLLSEELLLLGIVVAVSFVYTAALLPISRFFERSAPLTTTVVVPAIAIVSSICIGLWFYAGFLPRSLSYVITRDWPFILSFGLLGLGYAFGYYLQWRI